MSKIPKPASFKLPKFPSRPLGTISENRINKFNEAPEPPSRTLHVPALKRRSKSLTDLRQLRGNFKKETPNENKLNVATKPANSKNITKTVPTKTVVGSKRTAPISSNNDEGPSKPKLSKKIPDWDYKGRFHQLNEKYTAAQDSIKTMKFRISGFEDIEANYEQVQKEVKELTEEKIILTEKCKLLSLENEKYRTELETLQNRENSLRSSHNELTKKFEEQSKKYTEIEEKFKYLCDENNDVLKMLNNANQTIKDLEEENETFKKELQNFQTERRRLHNVIQDLKGNIRVFCRIRPPINSSEMDLLQCSIAFIDSNALEIKKSRESVNQITGKLQDFKGEFSFDRVFKPESTQEDVFEDLAQLVQSALDGYNVCVFAYGQTGSGKTYTMQGGDGPDHRGMIPRTVDLIFKGIEQLNKSGWKYNVQASFLEIYNENVRDLLNMKNSQKLEIYHNEGKGTTVTNLTIQDIDSASSLKYYMNLAHKNRATAATDFNEHSSRSHAVTKICLEGTLEDKDTVLRGSINLVDLAGSESAKTTINEDRLTETKNINKSLATLGDVISALFSKSKHIPYRNSKLTYLLQSSLGGNSKTLMVVNVAPFEDCFNETINSLRFAAKVKEVKMGCKRNKMALMPPQMKS